MRFPRWLRRNLVPLGAIVVLAPACALVTFGLPWAEYQARTPDHVIADAGDDVDFNGLGWRLERTGEFVGTGTDGNGIPLDSSIVAALITVTPGDPAGDGPFCSFELRQDPDAAHPDGRRWRQVLSPDTYRYGVGEESSTYCDPERTDPYQLELVFLVPEGVYGNAFIDAEIGSDRDPVLRFPMEP